MKKTYTRPLTTEVRLPALRLLGASDPIRSDKGIGYGGVDEEGEHEVDARRPGHRNVWDDDDEEGRRGSW